MQQQSQPRQTLTPQQAMAQAVQSFEAGRLPQSENICRLILQAQPDFAPAWFQLGLIAARSDKMPLAADLVAEAARFAPQNGPYHRALCEIYRRLGRFAEAAACGRQAVALMPGDTDAHYNFALALADGGAGAEAAEQYRKALASDPSHGLSANNLGTLLEKAGDEKGAEEAYARAAAINPRHAEAQNNLGALFSARGELDRARQCFSDAIAAEPGFVHAHYNLSTLKKYKVGDPHLAALEEVAKNAGNLPDETRLRFCFAIGKALEDVGRYDESFLAYAEGNRLKRLTFQYDERNTARNIDHIIESYDRGFSDDRGAAGKKTKACVDETPVFIVGMPRSGTTLIEQIVATHSKAHGAGELHDLGDIIREVAGQQAEGDYIDWLKEADGKLLAKLGEAYVARLRALHPTAARITDKMPGNYYYLGLIHKILPKAKIIHAVRDPLDTCFSNFSRLFNETMVFAYDLGELGRYYGNYRRLMEHWKAVLPEGTILDMRYEDLVADQEAQSRRLLDFCGLDWEQGCLDFHKNSRPVRTASVAQVREPIYKTSVARWERFEKHLAPLRAAIDQGAAASDRGATASDRGAPAGQDKNGQDKTRDQGEK